MLNLTSALVDPFGISLPTYETLEAAAADQAVAQSTLTTMATLFVSPFATFCYLILILLYTPCVAAMGALVREAGNKWGWLIIGWSTILAYGSAVCVYQIGTWQEHPVSSLFWVTLMISLIVGYYQLLVLAGRIESRKLHRTMIPTKAL